MLRPSPPAMNQPWLSQLSEQKNIRLSPWQVWAIIQVLVGCLVARCCKKLQLPGVDLGFPDTYLRGSTRCLFLPFLSQFSNLLLVSHRTHLTIVHSDLKDNLHQCTHLGHSKSFHSVCLVVCRGVSRCLFVKASVPGLQKANCTMSTASCLLLVMKQEVSSRRGQTNQFLCGFHRTSCLKASGQLMSVDWILQPYLPDWYSLARMFVLENLERAGLYRGEQSLVIGQQILYSTHQQSTHLQPATQSTPLHRRKIPSCGNLVFIWFYSWMTKAGFWNKKLMWVPPVYFQRSVV